MTPEPRTLEWRRDQLQRAQLYLCTDARLGTGDFVDFVDAAYRGGVDIIQLRDKHLDAGDELEYFDLLADAAHRHGRLFAANDRADVALLSGADVLHLGQRDLSDDDARRILPDDVLLGRSTHNRIQAQFAWGSAADYFCIGPVWLTPTKPGRAATGVEAVAQVAALHPDKPWFAIGGINVHTVPDVVAAGANRIVVVRAITQAEDPEVAARALRAQLPQLPSAQRA